MLVVRQRLRTSAMISIVAASLLLCLSGCQAPLPRGYDETIRIGSFNIQAFGGTKAGRPGTMAVLAEIVERFDVLAIQEVGSGNSSASEATCIASMETLLSGVNAIAGEEAYSYVRFDQYAIIYKNSSLELLLYGPYSGGQSFVYPPLSAYFKSRLGNLDYSIMSVHTSPSKATLEIAALPLAMADVALAHGDPDVICAGDFNADGFYYDEGSGTDLAAFPSGSFITVIPNTADTTVASSSNTYDRMQITQSMSSDYSWRWDVYEFGRYHDVTRLEGTESMDGTESSVSDHYPVRAEFYIRRDTD
ncbi:MAG: endonuclease/exonuclease/phosphatase family protein [Spirochaetia bacterium]|nr:endonuclease/exonuclease/phosphatase family protein [Spirochaetia bacterium]